MLTASVVHAQTPLPSPPIDPALLPRIGCRFDPVRLSFEGTKPAQARCLLRPVARYGRLGPTLRRLPPILARLIGTAPSVNRTLAASWFAQQPIALAFDAPVSHARDNDASAPLARYFVIHDTSSPQLGAASFPRPLDSAPSVNDVTRFLGDDAVAHVFNDRLGTIRVGHDFGVPWRATKLEKSVGLPAKGLFLHVETVQPRRHDPDRLSQSDALAPTPGFSAIQYRRLAQLYVLASLRARHWLVPAYHAAIDDGIPDGHDDPQHFRLGRFDLEIGRVLRAISRERPQPH